MSVFRGCGSGRPRNLTRCACALSLKAFQKGVKQQISTDWRDDGGEREREKRGEARDAGRGSEEFGRGAGEAVR